MSEKSLEVTVKNAADGKPIFWLVVERPGQYRMIERAKGNDREHAIAALADAMAWLLADQSIGEALALALPDFLKVIVPQPAPPSTEMDILRARVELLRETHDMAYDGLRSAKSIAERQGRDTNWQAFLNSISMSLEACHAALDALRNVPKYIPPTGDIRA